MTVATTKPAPPKLVVYRCPVCDNTQGLYLIPISVVCWGRDSMRRHRPRKMRADK
jgi:hypothetical protein